MAWTRRHKRLALIGTGLAALAGALALVLVALSETVTFFFTPADLAGRDDLIGKRIRLGGLVEAGSVVRSEGPEIRFSVTDMEGTTPVVYVGLLPDLFREGQGVVAEGVLESGGTFRAEEVLAKHDENYMPPEVARKIEKLGHPSADDDVSGKGY